MLLRLRLAQDHQKKTLNPTWNEDKWLLVQEAKTQYIRAQVFDHDAINLKVRAHPPCSHRTHGPLSLCMVQ